MMITMLYRGEGVGIQMGRREKEPSSPCCFHGRRQKKQEKRKWR